MIRTIPPSRRRRHPFAPLACGVLLASACGGSAASRPAPQVAPRQEPAQAEASADAPEAPSLSTAPSCEGASVYFDLDSQALDTASRDRLAAARPCFDDKRTLTVTGMTDPRGTEEYNLALGQRRAKSVADYLTSLGADPQKVHVRSVGEETATGTDETGWSQDRRAELQPN